MFNSVVVITIVSNFVKQPVHQRVRPVVPIPMAKWNMLLRQSARYTSFERTEKANCSLRMSSHANIDSLLAPMAIRHKKLMGPGPANCSPRVLNAMSQPLLGHLHPDFCTIMDDIKVGIQYLFQTQNTMTIALSATGHGAMECLITNACEPGETLLVACNGIWGDRYSVNWVPCDSIK